MSSDCTRVLAFYAGTGVDDRGRHIDDVLAFDDAALEDVHDYIQWLFPLDVPSGVMPHAPLVDADCGDAFAADPRLRATLHRAFDRMLTFYGLRLVVGADGLTVVRAEDFGRHAENWLTRQNHNFLRLTRILRSLHLLGEAPRARALFACLEALYRERHSTIGERTFAFWTRAASGES